MDGNSITFLGTAGDITSMNKQLRASGGIILFHNGSQFHIDPGPGSLNQCKNLRINPRNTLALIVTNNDIGHCNDTNAIISAMTHEGMDNRGVIVGSKSVIEGSEYENSIIWKRYKSYLEKNITLKAGERIGINETEFFAIPAISKDPTAFGLRINAGNTKITYSSDTKYSSGLIRHYENSDILILKVPFLDNEENPNKMTILDAKKIILETAPKIVILTGLGSKFIYSDPLFITRELQRETGTQIISAHDGMNISLNLYEKKEFY